MGRRDHGGERGFHGVRVLHLRRRTLGDNGRCLYLGKEGAIYVAGGTLSTNFPIKHPQQSAFASGSHQYAPSSGDCTVLKFVAPRDSDGDGRTNFDEFVHGTNTLDGKSFLKLGITVQPTSAEITLPGLKGRRYTLKRSLHLDGWTELPNSGILSADQPVTLFDAARPSDEAYYHVVTEFP